MSRRRQRVVEGQNLVANENNVGLFTSVLFEYICEYEGGVVSFVIV